MRHSLIGSLRAGSAAAALASTLVAFIPPAAAQAPSPGGPAPTGTFPAAGAPAPTGPLTPTREGPAPTVTFLPPQAPPGAPPGAPPPPAGPWAPGAPFQSPPFSPPAILPAGPPPSSPPPAPAAPSMAGRVGFGIGLYAIPGAALGDSTAFTGPFGAETGIRWWVTERLALLPSIHLAYTQEVRQTDPDFPEQSPPTNDWSALFAPELLFSFAAYRGQTTRLMLTGGPGFSYGVVSVNNDTTSGQPPVEVRLSTFSLKAGIALEQSLTSRLSTVLSITAPVFSYTSRQSDGIATKETMSLELTSTQLGASLFFYTD